MARKGGSDHQHEGRGCYLQAAGHHAVHGVATATSDADDLDAGVSACRHRQASEAML